MSFKVRLAPSGREFLVEAEETLLAAALRQGVVLPYGCRNGQCGTCVGWLEAGTVHYPSGKTEGLKDQGSDACLTCQALPLSDLALRVREVARAAEIEVRVLPCRVERKEILNHDVIRLYLKLPEGQRLQFFAGQYLNFLLSDGRKRAFSIANAPHDDALIELHLRHVPHGTFTDYVFEQMREKAILRIEAPLGTFFLREEGDRPLILVGGGTGFAPLKGMIEHAFHIGLGRPLHLYWGVRSRRDLYLLDLPERWVREQAGFRYTPVLSEPDSDWTGRCGFVHQAVMADYPDLSGFDLYLSGPPVMVHAGREGFLAQGASPERMFSDAFEYAADRPAGS